MKSEALLRLLITDLVGEEVTRENIGTLREDIADLRVRLDRERASRVRELPHRAKYLQIANRHLRRLLDLHEQLIDEVERELR